MTTTKNGVKHSPGFKSEALKLADQVGIAAETRASRRVYQAKKGSWLRN